MTTQPFYALQVVESFHNQADAEEAFRLQQIQDGYLGGRILPPPTLGWWEPEGSRPSTEWRIQVFFEDCNPSEDGNSPAFMPDGVSRVLILPSFAKTLKLKGCIAP